MGVEQVVDKPPVAAGRRRRWLRRLLMVPVVFVAFTFAQVLVLRIVDPPLSMVMVWRCIDEWSSGNWKFRLHHQWRDLDQIASSAPISMVAAEDQRFPEHHGFDMQAIKKAVAHNADGGHLRGASTISQQVSKNLFLWEGRSWIRKGLEAWYTVLIELLWPKQRIIEMYVNIAEYGDGIYGVQAAARQFWGKDASRLTSAESARLAAVLPSPRRWNARNPGPYVRRRAVWIQRQVRQLGGPAYLQPRQ